MSQRPFRFLHAADLHLDRPPSGLAEAPEHLLDLLINCPLRAATHVFDAAINQRVDFVVLAGGVCDPSRCGPRELLFLVEQFERLQPERIAVYWAIEPSTSAADWPRFIVWPPNVRRFCRDEPLRHVHQIDGVPVCEIAGSGHRKAERADIFSVAVTHTPEFGVATLDHSGVDYWALGGRHDRSTMRLENGVVHYPGSPQGRRPPETGPRGCTLVQVDEERRVQLTPMDCDVLRWQSERLSLAASSDGDELERLLRTRASELRSQVSGIASLVTWMVSCEGKLLAALRHGALASQLTEKLRSEFGQANSPLWTISIEPELPHCVPIAWRDEEMLRGDFLRALDGHAPATLSSLVSSMDIPAEYAAQLAALAFDGHSPGAEQEVVREAAWLGAELLSPEEAVS